MNIPAALHIMIAADAILAQPGDTAALERAACGRELACANPPFIRHLSGEQLTTWSDGYYFGLKVREDMTEMGMA